MTVPQKPCIKKVVLFAIPVIEKEKELYAEIYYSSKGIVDSNHAFFQRSKEKQAEIF